MEYRVVQGSRVIFFLKDEPGDLVTAKETFACEFASGKSMDPARESIVMEAAKKAKSWDNFVFKLKLEGFELQAGTTLKLPFGKL